MKRNDTCPSDRALREALRNIQQNIDSSPLPEDFEERVMSRIREMEKQKQSLPHLSTGRRRLTFAFRRVAAVLLAVAIIGGMAYAMVRMIGGSLMPADRNAGNDALSQTELAANNVGESVLFDNVRLDSIVGIVAAHYGRQVCFLDEDVREVRLSTTWRRDTLLGAFIGTVNEFEGLMLRDEHDTIFVTSTEEEWK